MAGVAAIPRDEFFNPEVWSIRSKVDAAYAVGA